MNASELRAKGLAELREELHNLLKEQFNLRMQQGSGQLAKPHLFREVRRNIARTKTIMHQKQRELQGQVAK